MLEKKLFSKIMWSQEKIWFDPPTKPLARKLMSENIEGCSDPAYGMYSARCKE